MMIPLAIIAVGFVGNDLFFSAPNQPMLGVYHDRGNFIIDCHRPFPDGWGNTVYEECSDLAIAVTPTGEVYGQYAPWVWAFDETYKVPLLTQHAVLFTIVPAFRK